MEWARELLRRFEDGQAAAERYVVAKGKQAQRRTYSLLVRRPLFCLVLLVGLALPLFNGLLLFFLGGCYPRALWTLQRHECTLRRFGDNIGGQNFEGLLSYGPIDVVYTWVNGSDPRWLARKREFERLQRERKAREEGAAIPTTETGTAAISSASAVAQGEEGGGGGGRLRLRRRLLRGETPTAAADAGSGVGEATFSPDTPAAAAAPAAEGTLPTSSSSSSFSSSSSPQGEATSAVSYQSSTEEAYRKAPPLQSPSAGPGPGGKSNQKEGEDPLSDNRFRDSNELRFSLRSLERFAPWVRHVYLVTDDQIPKWLDMDSPRLTVVPHSAIFPNKSHLPVFSSPAIESHLHRIPGLSSKFIYFNDDVFLGAPTLPEDFVQTSGVQKVYLSWDVPRCAEGCADAWLGDGYCDKACNVSSCAWDHGDCLGATSYGANPNSPAAKANAALLTTNNNKGKGSLASTYTVTSNKGAGSKGTCAPGCPNAWVGDKICDARCNTPECAWDAGDCGVGLVYERMKGTALDASYLLPAPSSPPSSATTPAPSCSSPSSSIAAQITALPHAAPPSPSLTPAPLLFRLPYGSPALYVNLTGAFPLVEGDGGEELEYLEAGHNNENVIQNAVLLRKHHLLLLLFPHDLSDAHMASITPGNVTITVSTLTHRRGLKPQPTSSSEDTAQTTQQQQQGIGAEGQGGGEGPSSFVSSSSDKATSQPQQQQQEGSTAPAASSSLPPSVQTITTLQTPEEREAAAVKRVARFRVELYPVPLPFSSSASTEADVIIAVKGPLPNSPRFVLKPLGAHYAALCSSSSSSSSESSGGEQNFGKKTDARGALQVDVHPFPVLDAATTAFPIAKADAATAAAVAATTAAVLLPSTAHGGGGEAASPPQQQQLQSPPKPLGVALRFSLPSATTRGGEEEKGKRRKGRGWGLFGLGGGGAGGEKKDSGERSEMDAAVVEITVYGPPPPSSPLPPLDAIESPLIAADAASAGGEKEGEEEGKPVVIKPLRECLLAWDKGGEEEEEEEAPAGAGSEDGDGNVSPSSQQQPRGKSLAPLLFPPPPLPSSSSSPSGLTVLVPVGEEAEAAATAGGGAGWVHATVRIFLSVTPPVASMNGTKSSSGRKSKRKKDKGAGAKKESKSSSSSVDEKQPPLYSLGKDGGLCADVLVEPWGPGGSARAVVIPSSASGGGEEEKDASVSSLSSSSPAAGASHQKRRLSPSSPSSSLTAGSELAPIRLGGEEEEAWWWEWADAETRPDFRYWRQLLLSSLHVEGGEAGEEQQQRLRRRLRRRLLDSYGQSLIHVNRLYHQAFGREQRRAPAHMPHMIDRALVQEMQDRWREEWDATSRHRFRAGDDMQYAFAFYYYLMNLHKARPLDIDAFWQSDLDVDGSGHLDDNELITLAALAMGRDPTYEYLMEIKACMLLNDTLPSSSSSLDKGDASSSSSSSDKGKGEPTTPVAPSSSSDQGEEGEETPSPPPPFSSSTNEAEEEEGEDSSSRNNHQPLIQEGEPRITLERLKGCPAVVEALNRHVRRPKTWEAGSVDEVTFQMLGDDPGQTRAQLNNIRAKKTKFICLNDDMRTPHPDVQALLQHFFLSLFPTRSRFELPYHLENRYLHLDDYERARRRMRWAKAGLVMSLALLICLVLYDLIYPTPPPPPAQGQEAAATSVVEGEEEGGEGGDSPSPSLPPQEPNPAAAGGNGGGGGQESAATAGKQHHLARERRRQQQQQLASTSPLLAAAALMSSRGRGAVGGDGEGSVATEKED